MWDNKLRYVRIFFATPTFVKIEKDSAVKFVDKVSAIGVNMVFLTGFSIISGVEVIYFTAKGFWNVYKKKRIH